MVGYSYDDENRLESVTTKYTNDTKTTSFAYDGASRLTGMSYPNGVNSTFGYDAESRILEYSYSSGSSNFLRHVIQRDPRGFKTIEDTYAGLLPNFTNEVHQTRTHNDADQLLSTGDTDYQYNANGCLTSSVTSAQSVDYSYDFDNRLTSANDVEYLYDASGVRVARIAGVSPAAVTNYFVVDYTDPLKRPLAETDSNGTITRYYIWAGFQLLAHIEADGTTRYYHSDEIGSTLALTDETGTVTDQFTYSPYGQAIGRTGSTETPFQWLGGYGVYYDSDTDLHLTLHRAYSAHQKRFISSDPMGIDGGVNLYAYGNLNPLAFVDPYGLCAEGGWNPDWDSVKNGVEPLFWGSVKIRIGAGTVALGAVIPVDGPVIELAGAGLVLNGIGDTLLGGAHILGGLMGLDMSDVPDNFANMVGTGLTGSDDVGDLFERIGDAVKDYFGQ